ncbi:hypothetical protein D0T49_06885 [Paludibacter sp. 221]|nr:hypothetical protein [Paludibacter sp. 221]
MEKHSIYFAMYKGNKGTKILIILLPTFSSIIVFYFHKNQFLSTKYRIFAFYYVPFCKRSMCKIKTTEL